MGSRLRGAAQAALVLLPVAAVAWFGWRRRWIAEDAFIDLRVVRMLLAGHGPVFNLGERVEVYTNPLWVALLAALNALLHPFTPLPLEWIAALAGLGCTVTGVLAAELGALRFARRVGAGGLALPLGALALVALPASWDFATSGLETGITLAWLGISYGWLGHLPAPTRWRFEAPLLAVLLGLGPLIRPDLAVLSAAFLVLLLASETRPLSVGRAPLGRRLLNAVGLVALVALLPVAYQVFRMGYFAAVVPNTAIAKEASLARWDQGWVYLVDFAGVYRLWVPGAALALWWLFLVARAASARAGWAALGLVVPVLAGAVHAAYVVRVGGDFMHGRMLLPSLFTLLLPVGVVAGTRWWHTLAPALVVVPWAVVCALWLRPAYVTSNPNPSSSVGPQGIADERGFYLKLSGRAHPVTLDDYANAPWARDGVAMAAVAEQRRVLFIGKAPVARTPNQAPPPEAPLAPGVPARVVAGRVNVGLTGYAAGSSVHLVDLLGLGDPIAARLRLEKRGRPGHEKELPEEWILARFADPAADPAIQRYAAALPAARAALACGDLAALLDAVQAPLTPARFLANVQLAWHLSAFRVPQDVTRARAELCG